MLTTLTFSETLIKNHLYSNKHYMNFLNRDKPSYFTLVPFLEMAKEFILKLCKTKQSFVSALETLKLGH